MMVEAAQRSGSLVTAQLELEQNRDVFAVLGSPLDLRAQGSNALIQQRAKLIMGAADILETLGNTDPARTALFDADWQPDVPVTTTNLAILGVTPIEVDELVCQFGLSAAI